MENKKILIVDDEKDVCKSIENILQERGVLCLVAYNGGDALSLIEKERPDLILLDIILPGIDGFEVCQRVRHDERFRDISIVILTCLGDKENRVAGFKAGAIEKLKEHERLKAERIKTDKSHFIKLLDELLIFVGLLRGNIDISAEASGTRFTIVFPKNIESPARRKGDKKL